jgi:1-phosphofructokinase family hexose kinase
MVLTVTINPLLERRLSFSIIEPGKVNRSPEETFHAGGKGINVSRQLNKLGVKNQAVTFAGGMNGKLLRRAIAAENINAVFVGTKSETRWAAVIMEKESQKVTSYFSPNQEILSSEADQFIQKLEKMIPNSSIVVFAGSSACAETDKIFKKGIEIAQAEDKTVILDTYGARLSNLIDLSPMILHNTVAEIEESLNIKLNSEEKKINFLRELYSKGIKLAFITDGANYFYSSKFDFIYKITPPKILKAIDATGSGDSFTSAVAEGLEKGLTFEEFVNRASKLGAVNASRWDTCAVVPSDLRSVENAEIEPIGKKMKIIDDSPDF